MSANGKRPAFPTQHVAAGNTVEGLTKRELFAAMAMQGYLANTKTAEALAWHATSESAIAAAVYAADCLLRKLEEGK